MRGANAYQALNETHQALNGQIEVTVPGRRYEALRDTQRELDGARPKEQQQGGSQSDLSQRIDRAEERRAALDQELAETRHASRGPERGPGQQHSQEDIAVEQALALKNQPSPAPAATAPPQNYVPPKDWADSGGMVAQQNSARAWLRQGREQQRQQAAPQPAPSQELRPQDQELLNAARAHEAQGHQQEPSRSKAHEYPGP
ncbi:MAG: hypothetical protein AB7P20_00260 [Rhizobiaceae bacterium]